MSDPFDEIRKQFGEQVSASAVQGMREHLVEQEAEKFAADPNMHKNVTDALMRIEKYIENEDGKPLGEIAMLITYECAAIGFLIRDIPPSVLLMTAAGRFREIEISTILGGLMDGE